MKNTKYISYISVKNTEMSKNIICSEKNTFYYNKLYTYQSPRLNTKEEKCLGYMSFYNQNKLSTKALVFCNIKLAIKIAYQYKKPWISLFDLIQEACIGMMIASRKWSPEKGSKFGTYASYWIKAQLNKFLVMNTRLININNMVLNDDRINLESTDVCNSSRGSLANLGNRKRKNLPSTKEVLIMPSLTMRRLSLFHYNYTKRSISSIEEKITGNQLKKGILKTTKNFYFLISDKRNKYVWKEYMLSNRPISLADLGRTLCISKQRVGQIVDKMKTTFRFYLIKKMGYKVTDFI